MARETTSQTQKTGTLVTITVIRTEYSTTWLHQAATPYHMRPRKKSTMPATRGWSLACAISALTRTAEPAGWYKRNAALKATSITSGATGSSQAAQPNGAARPFHTAPTATTIPIRVEKHTSSRLTTLARTKGARANTNAKSSTPAKVDPRPPNTSQVMPAAAACHPARPGP